MTTVTDAIEAGARAYYEGTGSHVQPPNREGLRFALAAAWPILSAPLRELHQQSKSKRYIGFAGETDWEHYCRHDAKSWPCPTAALILQTDKELGL